MAINRRDFLKNSSVVLAGLTAATTANTTPKRALATSGADGSSKISELKKNTAIAMWDFSWILRHHRYGSFENWDEVLEGLAERGYDSIRMDCMPQFVAADTDGTLQEEFRAVRNHWGLAMWGNDVTMSFNPREAMLEFLPLCKKYGIKVGLSSWFMRHGTDRTAIFEEEGGLLRAWKETLAFLDKNGLLDENIMYVDLLNEYPDWHGYDWLKQAKSGKLAKLDNPDAHLALPEEEKEKKDSVSKHVFDHNQFLNNLFKEIRASFPQCDYFASTTSSYGRVDVSHFDAIDHHIWFENHWTFPGLDVMHGGRVNVDLKELHSNLRKYWDENRKMETEWMDKQITAVANDARKHNVVCGNTEGWGCIGWYDHPEVDWRFIKESAEICVDLCLKHDNYKFICTSNFTHPHFKGYWEDVKWHKKVTSIIRNG